MTRSKRIPAATYCARATPSCSIMRRPCVSALELRGPEFNLIADALGFDKATPLTLENVSEIYRRGWLAPKPARWRRYRTSRSHPMHWGQSFCAARTGDERREGCVRRRARSADDPLHPTYAGVARRVGEADAGALPLVEPRHERKVRACAAHSQRLGADAASPNFRWSRPSSRWSTIRRARSPKVP